jgi:hypothetical protein
MSNSAMVYNSRQVIETCTLTWIHCHLLSRGESYEKYGIYMMLKYVSNQFNMKVQFMTDLDYF